MIKYPAVKFSLDDDNAQAKLVRLVGTGKRVIEFGCASGYVSKILKNIMKCTVVGVENEPESARQAEQHCEQVVLCDIEDVDFASTFGKGCFDVATFGDVLEHLRNPWEILRKTKEVLNADGYVVASIPNISHISVVMELLEGRFDYRPLGLLDESHLRFFTKKSIMAMMHNAGFEIVHWDRVIRQPDATEFGTSLASYPDSLISFLGQGNEGLTYQYIIKATPRQFEKGRDEQEQLAILEARAKVKELETDLVNIAHQLSNANSELAWVYNTLSWRLTKPIRKIIELINKW
ncbi:MAG: class I SAM-dependent methyltransferase [Desulfuromonadales bacterium]|nr:MAG: class I SAM-dependent methyltransferase [Desulfuromonadales bacterium]